MNLASRFIYVHDPMCSWCWAFKPTWQKFEAELSKIVKVECKVGGLAPDSDVPMPEAQQNAISGYWHTIHEKLGTEFNFDFWTKNTPRRSTYPACRAVIAARWQDAESEMIIALQTAYYLRALNPSDIPVHIQLAEELGLDVDKFQSDITSNALEQAFQQELSEAHALPIQGFPSLVLFHKGQVHGIVLNYEDYRPSLEQVKEILGS